MKRIIALLIATLFCLIVISLADGQSDPAYVKNMENPTAQKIEDDIQDYLYEKFELFIDSVTWCFEDDCDNQTNVEFIGKIIERYGYTDENYGVAAAREDGIIELRIVVISKTNPEKRYLHLFFLEVDDSIDIEPEDLGGIS